MPNLSIKEVPETLAETLRQRAAHHHRSLQGELMAILEAAAFAPAATAAVPPAYTRSAFARAAREFRRNFSAPLGKTLDSAATIRQMRDEHYGAAWVAAGVKDGPVKSSTSPTRKTARRK